MKRIVSLLLSLLMLVSIPAGMTFTAQAAYPETIEVGLYPQTRVANESLRKSLVNRLVEANPDTITFDYYSCAPDNTGLGNMTNTTRLMVAADVWLNGVRYRGVQLEEYRPAKTSQAYGAANSLQDDNCYALDYKNIQFFELEPLVWDLIDANKGVYLCRNIIDSQPLNEYLEQSYVTVEHNGLLGKETSKYYSGVTVNRNGNDGGDYYDSDLCRYLANRIILEGNEPKLYDISLPSHTTDLAKIRQAAVTDYAKAQGFNTTYNAIWSRLRVAESVNTGFRDYSDKGNLYDNVNHKYYNEVYISLLRPAAIKNANSATCEKVDANNTGIGVRPTLTYRKKITVRKTGSGTGTLKASALNSLKPVYTDEINSKQTDYYLHPDDQLLLEATPNSGNKFVCWYDKDGNKISNTGDYNKLNISNPTEVSARFSKKYNVVIDRTQSVIIYDDDGDPVESGLDQTIFDDDHVLYWVDMDSIPEGYVYDGWNINDQPVSSEFADENGTIYASQLALLKPPATVVILSPRLKLLTYKVKLADVAEGGTVSGGGTYEYNTSCKVTAKASEGYAFEGWYEGTAKVSSDAAYTFTVKKDVTLEAYFVPNEYQIKAVASPQEGGTVSGADVYAYGTKAHFDATANNGYRFVGWYVGTNCVSTEASFNYRITGAVTLTAKFEKSSDGSDPETPPAALTPGEATETEVEDYITSRTTDADPPGTKFAKLRARQKKVTKNSITVTWTKPSKAAYYVVYENRCGGKYKLKKVKKLTKTTFTKKKLKKNTYYKFWIAAYDKNGVLVGVSKTLHIATLGGKKGNCKYVKTAAKKNAVTLKKGKTFKLKGKAVKDSAKKTVKVHRKLKYESTNKKIATVSAKGVIKAKKKGTCYIYVYAQNGKYKKIKVTVKN